VSSPELVVSNKWYQSKVVISGRSMSQHSSAGRSSAKGRRNQLHSPPPRPRHRDGAWVVERVVEKTTTGIVYPMLTRMNYTEWSAVMRVNLQAAELWEAIKYGDVEYRDDRHTLAALLRAVPADIQAGLANKETAREAWEVIRKIRVGADRVKEANAERLRQEFAEIKFKPGKVWRISASTFPRW
jgi:hypothetical protein